MPIPVLHQESSNIYWANLWNKPFYYRSAPALPSWPADLIWISEDSLRERSVEEHGKKSQSDHTITLRMTADWVAAEWSQWRLKTREKVSAGSSCPVIFKHVKSDILTVWIFFFLSDHTAEEEWLTLTLLALKEKIILLKLLGFWPLAQ